MNLPCSLCECLKEQEWWTPERTSPVPVETGLHWKFFHEPCSKCPPSAPTSEPLCAFCSHLRLPHLIRCVIPALAQIWEPRPDGTNIRKFMFGDRVVLVLALDETYISHFDLRACTWCRALYQLFDRYCTYEVPVLEDLGKSEFATFLRPRNIVIAFLYRRLDPDEALPRLELMSLPNDFCGRFGTQMVGQRDAAVPDCQYLVPKLVDWHKIRGHIGKCNRQCGLPYLIHSLDPVPCGFRLIDVENACVERTPFHLEYAALSYVWGSPCEEELTCTLENVKELEQRGRLAHDDVPQTIRDAMQACSKLGIRFLWVDRFCIVQNDNLGKHEQIQRMGEIYASAKMTLIAIGGKDARYGLPGISRPRCMPQAVVALQGIQITELPDPLDYSVKNSGWAERGWTLQEQYLSKTLLYFTDQGAQIECCNKSCAFQEGNPLPQSIAYNDMDYFIIVKSSSTRGFRYESDILFALNGIMQKYFGDRHSFGIPWDDIDRAMLWRAESCIEPREIPHGQASPSWSWASFKGRVTYEDNPLRTLFSGDIGFCGPIVSWAIPLSCQGHKSPQLIPAGSRHPWRFENSRSWGHRQDWAAMALAWKNGCFASAVPDILAEQQNWKDLLNTMFSLWPSYEDFWSYTRGISDDRSCKPSFTRDFSGAEIATAAQPGRLLVRTQSSTLHLVYNPMEREDGHNLFLLEHEDGQWAGTLWLDELHSEALEPVIDHDEPCSAEFIALSLCHCNIIGGVAGVQKKPDSSFWEPVLKECVGEIPEKRNRKYTDDEINFLGEVDYYDSQGQPFTEFTGDFGFPPTLAVMMIERRQGIAYRIGIGHVFLKRWVESNPELTNVILG